MMQWAALASLAVVMLLASAASTRAQALGDVAKQEAERRKSIGSPGKVYTNDSLRIESPPSGQSAPGAAPPAPAAPATPAAQPSRAAGPGGADPEAAPATEEEWRKRMAGARDALARSQVFAEALQSRINALTADFANRDDPAQRAAVAAERQKALAELDRVKQEVADQQKAIGAIQDDARRAGVPAGWVR